MDDLDNAGSYQDIPYAYGKAQAVMISMGIFHLLFIGLSGYLVAKVFQLVKFKDLPILLSISSVLLSLVSKPHFDISIVAMFIWLALFLAFFHADKDSILHTTNLLRAINFTATNFFGFALIFDLYKW